MIFMSIALYRFNDICNIHSAQNRISGFFNSTDLFCDPGPVRFIFFFFDPEQLVQTINTCMLTFIRHHDIGIDPESRITGMYNVLLKSDNVADNYLAIHFDATQRCRATLTVLDYYLQTFDEEEKASWQELNGRQFPTAMQAQIGDAPRGEINAQIHFEFDETDSPQGLLSVSFKASTRFIQDLQEQPQADLRYRKASGEWTDALSYSLTSAQAGIGSAVGHCKEWAREVRGPEVIVM